MKKSRFFSALIFVVLSFILVPAAAKAALWEVPTGLKPGDTFHWVFVTSQSTTAVYPDIEYYNTFVNKLFDGPYNPEVSGLVGKDSLGDIDWKAIASADPGVYALDNIGLTTSGIYNPTGTLVANGTTNMLYGGYHTLAAPIMINELGESCECAVWTGTPHINEWDPAGGSGTMGDSTVIFGLSFSCSDWCYWDSIEPTNELPLYAISEELTVVPVPGALILGAMGLLSSTLGLKRLRRKDQEPSQI